VGDGGSMDDCGVTDYAVGPNNAGRSGIGMNHCIVLDIGSFTDANGIGIASENCPEPERCICFYYHITDGCCVGGDEGGWVNIWR